MAIKTALVEDDAFTRLTLATAIRSIGLEVILETGSASQALLMAKRESLQLAILDLHLGQGPTGVDVAIELRKLHPEIGLVFLSSFEDPRLLSSNLPELPSNSIYLTKSKIDDIEVIKDAVRAALDRNALYASQASSSLGNLSDIQIETLRLMAQGLSNAEIAKRRFVTERSVEIAIARIAKKLGVEKNPSINQRVHIANVYFRATGQSISAS